MAVPYYSYLLLKMPGPNGVNTVKGSFTLLDNYDREFSKISESFGMAAKYTELKGTIDYNVLPEVGRSLPDQAFDSIKDTQEIQVHPSDPKKMTFIASNLDAA
jgi:hypothetical protein